MKPSAVSAAVSSEAVSVNRQSPDVISNITAILAAASGNVKVKGSNNLTFTFTMSCDAKGNLSNLISMVTSYKPETFDAIRFDSDALMSNRHASIWDWAAALCLSSIRK